MSVLGGSIWYAEVLLHGWEGLIWTSYTHLAPLPVSAIFLLWLVLTPMARSGSRGFALVGLAACWAAVCIWRQQVVLRALFDWYNPTAIPELVASTIAMPVGAWCIGRMLGYRLRWWTLPLSVLLVCSYGLGAYFTRDFVHAVKTGTSVPFVVFGIGLPWCFGPWEPRQSDTV